MAQVIVSSPPSGVNADAAPQRKTPHLRKIRQRWRITLGRIIWYVLCGLSEYLDPRDICTVSIARLARESHLSQQTVRDAIKVLLKRGLLRRQKRLGRSYRWKLLLDAYDLTSHAVLPEGETLDVEVEEDELEFEPWESGEPTEGPLSHGGGDPSTMETGTPPPWSHRSDYKEATTGSEEESAARTPSSPLDMQERATVSPRPELTVLIDRIVDEMPQVQPESAPTVFEHPTPPPSITPIEPQPPKLSILVNPEDQSVIEAFRTAYRQHVDAEYRFRVPYPVSEVKAAQQLRHEYSLDDIQRIVDFVVHDHYQPKPGKTWTGWAGVIQSLAAVAARASELDSASRRAKTFKRLPSADEQAELNRQAQAKARLDRERELREALADRDRAANNPNPEILKVREEIRRKLGIRPTA